MVPEFANEALSDFSDPAQRQAMQSALNTVKAEFSREWPLVIGGERITSGAWTDSLNPCQKTQVVGRVARATRPRRRLAILFRLVGLAGGGARAAALQGRGLDARTQAPLQRHDGL
jgi:hypothetical protein